MLRSVRTLFRNWFRQEDRDRELDDELRACLDLLVQEKMEDGLSLATAQRQARLELGATEQIKESVREARLGYTFQGIWRDAGYAVRMLRRHPGYTFLAVLTLTLGIGANTAIFSLLDATLFRMLPVDSPERLVVLDRNQENPGKGGAQLFATDDYETLADHATTLSALAYAAPESAAVQVDGQMDLAELQHVSDSFFDVLGVNPAIGSLPRADDAPASNDAHLAVISDRYWNRRFGRDPSVLGRTIFLRDIPLHITAVTSREFFGVTVGSFPDLWISYHVDPPQHPTPWLNVMARLAPGTSPTTAASETNSLLGNQSADQSGLPAAAARGVVVSPASRGLSALRARFAQPLRVVMLLVVLVFLIACANVTCLFLAQLTARRQEIEMRQALGASRFRVFRQILVESQFIALLGGLAGLLVAYQGTGLLSSMVSDGTAPLRIGVEMNARVAGFALLGSIAAGLLFGLTPAWIVTRPKTVLRVHGGTGVRSNLLARRMLVVAQIGLCCLLVVSAGLLSRSLEALRDLDPDIAYDGVLLVTVNPSIAGYSRSETGPLLLEIRDRLASLPDVRSAGMGRASLLSGGGSAVPLIAEGNTDEDSGWVASDYVSPGYFDTLGMPLTHGREFDGRESDTTTEPSVVLNEAAARHYFDRTDVVGRRLGYQTASGPVFPFTIVGVVVDARYRSLREPPKPMVYLAFPQQDSSWGYTTYHLRTDDDPRRHIQATLATVRNVAQDIPIYDVKTLAEQRDQSLVQERLAANLAKLFAILALAISCVGLYGVMSYSVIQRTRELGIRTALGAQRGALLRGVLGEALKLIGIGLLLGIPATLASTHVLSSLLFGITGQDPRTFIETSLILITVATAAAYFPARRAARIDPWLALRHD